MDPNSDNKTDFRRHLCIRAACALLISFSSTGFAMSESTNFVLPAAAFSSGGGVSQSDRYRVITTLGGGFAPLRIESEQYTLWNGFIAQIASTVPDMGLERAYRLYLYLRAIQSAL